MMSIIVAHASWAPGRAESLGRLKAAFGPGAGILVISSAEKQHANVWARRVWEWIAKLDARGDADATIVLNDDVIPHPDLLRHCEDIVSALPGQVISLHGNFPKMREHALAGAARCRCYWPSGPAYILPRGMAAELLAWLDTTPPDWFQGPTNEDGAIAGFLWSRQTPTYATIPALVRHDTTVPSTLAGYDDHPNRTSHVDWLEGANGGFPIPDWKLRATEPAPYVPVPWMTDAQMNELGKALRGIRPPPPKMLICAFCRRRLSTFMDPEGRVGLCLHCAVDVTGAVANHLRPMLAAEKGQKT